MKKISNSIRIGLVPRTDVASKLDSEHAIPNGQSSMKEKVHSQNNYTSHGTDPPRDHQHMIRFTSPTNVRLHDTNDMNSNKGQPSVNDVNNYHSLPPTRPRQGTVSDLCEVPSKTKKVTMKKVLIGLAIALIIIAIIVGVILAVVLTRPKDTTITTTISSTSLTSTIAPLNISVEWSFDNVANDLDNVYNGTLVNGAIYSNGTPTTVPYFGSGQALLLNGINQFVSVPSPILPLNLTSFTIEAWIFPSVVTSDRGIFGECECSGCINQCLYFICRSGRLFVDFTMNDLFGSTILVINTWYHVAFVYNYQTRQQILYVNGIQDGIKSNAAPYQGTNGSIQIGSTQVFSTMNFFTGYIDNVQVTTRAKSSEEILRDASLVVYYPFDLPDFNADHGPNKIYGNSTNLITVNGRINQAIRFVGLSSFFQVYGLSQVPSGVYTNRPFSVSLWINPTVISSCTFVQFFSISPLRCANFLGIFSNGGSTGQIFVQGTGAQAILTGPFLTTNVWTHISITYNATNGYTLYFNGVYFGSASSSTYTSSATLTSLYIGYYAGCPSIYHNTPCQGSVDEVYVHNRELTQIDITTLANP